jgi:hypothetical protein
MKTRLTLRPGQNGTKKLTAQYGGQLVCVRYRYDVQRQLRIKTIELIVQQQPWIPPPSQDPNRLVLVHIGFGETTLRIAARQAGGNWIPEQKLWRLKLSTARELGLERRIVARQ